MKSIEIEIDEELIKKYGIGKVKEFISDQLKNLEDDEILRDMTTVSDSSLDFWDNEVDDRIWNDI